MFFKRKSLHVSVRRFTRNSPLFYYIQIFFQIKTGYSLIDFDMIFPIQSSEFIKSLNFGSNLKKKTARKNLKIFLKALEPI